MRLKSLLLFLFFVPASSYCQASFLDKGENGVGLSLGYSKAEQVDFYHASFAATSSGIFDFGAAVTSLEPDGGEFYSFGLTVEYYAVRQKQPNGSSQINLSVLGNFTGFQGQGGNTTLYGLGIGASFQSALNQPVCLVPSATAAKYWPTDSEIQSETVFTVGLSIVFRISNALRFNVVPSYNFSSDVNSSSIFTGMTLVGKKKNDK